jgi:hypothetical protein
MTTPAPHPDYPQNITSDEARLGFSLHLIGGLDEYSPDRWIPVVCKVLSSSDIVVKTAGFIDGVMYSHRRFGVMDTGVVRSRERTPDWNPVGNPYATCEQAVFEAETGASQEDGPLVTGHLAPIKEA